jgi:hypothetical protein
MYVHFPKSKEKMFGSTVKFILHHNQEWKMAETMAGRQMKLPENINKHLLQHGHREHYENLVIHSLFLE